MQLCKPYPADRMTAFKSGEGEKSRTVANCDDSRICHRERQVEDSDLWSLSNFYLSN